jgi:hypothetical protein
MRVGGGGGGLEEEGLCRVSNIAFSFSFMDPEQTMGQSAASQGSGQRVLKHGKDNASFVPPEPRPKMK